VAVVVTVGTLLIQGTTLPLLARHLDVRAPDPREDALQMASVMQAATRAGLARLDARPDVDSAVRDLLSEHATDRVNQLWERIGARADAETPSDRYRALRLDQLGAERAEVLRLRDAGKVDHQVLRRVLAALDVEETMLARIDEGVERVRDSDVLLPEHLQGRCEHLSAAPVCVEPRTPQGCAECLRDGTEWVYLRLCLTCGHVGCCDSSVGRHAAGHWRETGHPVMRSIEPGEAWRWCYIDDLAA
jgi:CPA1 family monovalent cation:H+ antiporter